MYTKMNYMFSCSFVEETRELSVLGPHFMEYSTRDLFQIGRTIKKHIYMRHIDKIHSNISKSEDILLRPLKVLRNEIGELLVVIKGHL